mmetsp:Transcript_69719/g.202134  ORF Transcript_69719/g.202134 Transcript_69719/m.202134 type:complete len:223 (+) Transcript_69719:88-756(+)
MAYAATPEYDYLFKLLLIGDSGVGKSCLLLRFADDTYTESYISTIGVDFKIRTLELDGKTCKLQIWDTAGQERYRAVTRSYYRGAVGALILYDVTSRESYNNLPTWLQDAREQAWKDISIIAVGNKRDLKEERQVSFLEASRFAQEQDILFLETSALTGENVQDVFHTLAQRILNKVEEGICDPTESRLGTQGPSDFDRSLDDGKWRSRGMCRCGLPRCIAG